MNQKESNKNMALKIDNLTHHIQMLELMLKSSSCEDDAMLYFGEGTCDYLDHVIDNASQVIGE
ncbi:MAG: hypothetical protein KIB43_04745 [Clostridium baratii]|uniref:hypothetical protein n=1 Tax=Clostridium baratii TaxID=1561 RepID=UPI0006C28121|nr:hypothetical protein [Clostridium baratii]MBS6006245.1 hypothetical protein [Clostridium baratii]MDU4911155.1 hypothetical protein [Clostridium baratii]CUP08612.1 Uncharacterised protein [Clostridium baratii]